MSQSCPIIVELEQSFKSTFKTFRKRLKKAVRLGKEDHRSNLCILDSLFVRGRLVYCASQVAQQGGLGGITDLLIDLLACQLLYYCPGGSSTLLPSSLHSFVKMGTTLLGGSVWLSRSLVAAWWILKGSCQLTPEAQNILAKVAMYSCRMCNKLIENSSENSQVSLSWTVLTLAGIVMHLSSNDQSNQFKTQIKRTLKDINTQLFVDFSNIVLCKENRTIQKKIKTIVDGKKTIPLKIILMNVSVDQLIKVSLELEALESADIESKEPEISQGYQNCLQDSLKILLETTIFSTLSRKNAENRKGFDKQLKRKEKGNIKHASKAKNKCKKQTFNSQNYCDSINDDLGISNMESSIPQINKHLNYIGGSLSESELEIVGVVAQCLKQYDINKKNKIVSSVPLPPTPPLSPGVDQIISNTVKATERDRTLIKTKLLREPKCKVRDDVDEMNQFEFDPVTRSRYDGSLSILNNENSFTTITSTKKKRTTLKKASSVEHLVTCCSHPVASSLSVNMNKTYPLYEKKSHVDVSGNNDKYCKLLPVKTTTNEKKEQIENKTNDSELEMVKDSNTSLDSVDSHIKGVTIKKNDEDLRFDSSSKILDRSNHSNSYVGEKSCNELEMSDMEYQSSYYSEVNLSPIERSDDSKNTLQNERNKHDESSDMNWNISYVSNLMDSHLINKGKKISSHNIKRDAKIILENKNPEKQFLDRNYEFSSNSENINSKRVEMENLYKISRESKSVCDSDSDYYNEGDLQNLTDESCLNNFVLRNDAESSMSQCNNMPLAKFDSRTLVNSDEARNVLVVEQQNKNISQEAQNENSSMFLSPTCSASSFFLNQECSSVNTNSPKAIRSNIHIHSSGDWICDRMLISGRRVCMILDFDNTSNENIFEVRLLVEMEYGVDEVTFPISLINYEKISSSFENRTIEKKDLSTHDMSIEGSIIPPSTPSIIPPTPKTPRCSYSFNFDSKHCAFSSKEFCANNKSFPINHHSNLNEFDNKYLQKRNENLNNNLHNLPVEDIPLSSGMGPETQDIFQKPNVCSTIELDNTSNLLQNQDCFIPPSYSDVTGPLTREIFYQQNNNYNSDKESIDGEEKKIMAYSSNDVPNQNYIESSCIEELENLIPIPISRPTKRKLNFNKFTVKNKNPSFINSSNSEHTQYSLPTLSAHFSSSHRNLSNTSGFNVEELGNNKLKHPLKLSYNKRTPSWISDSLESFSSNEEKPTVSACFQRKKQSFPKLQRSVSRKGLIRHYNKMRFRTKKSPMYNRNKKK